MSGVDLMIFGAREGSLGDAVRAQAVEIGWTVRTVGISGDEDERIDFRKREAIDLSIRVAKPEMVLCTIGMNEPESTVGKDYLHGLTDHFLVNVVYPMAIVQSAIEMDAAAVAVVSSNSAHIPRTNSGAYCASKAALSMALRVAAREGARRDDWPLIYGYEFGLLASTPMTAATRASLPAGTPLSRMPGNEEGLDVHEAAVTILAGLARPWPGMNGMMFRYDCGEL